MHIKAFKEFKWKRGEKSIAPVDFNDVEINFASEEFLEMDQYIPIVYTFNNNFKRALVTLHSKDKRRKLLNSPFLYQAQIKYADSISIIETKQLNVLASRGHKLNLVFLFSIGRAGTTLLSKIFTYGEYPCISEPDFYSNYIGPQRRPLLCRENLSILGLYTATKLLSRLTKKSHFAIKFRSFHASIGHILMNIFPNALPIIILRNPVDWSSSMLKAFNTPPQTMVWYYQININLLKFLKFHSFPFLIFFYEDFINNPSELLKKINAFLKTNTRKQINALKALKALNEDSQANTALSQSTLASRPIDETTRNEFLVLFSKWLQQNKDVLEELNIYDKLSLT